MVSMGKLCCPEEVGGEREMSETIHLSLGDSIDLVGLCKASLESCVAIALFGGRTRTGEVGIFSWVAG